MDLLKLNLKLYFKSKTLSILTIIFFSVIGSGLTIYFFSYKDGLKESPIFFLLITLMVSSVLPILFMFLAYEYCYKFKNISLDECVHGVHNGALKLFLSQFGVLLILAGIITFLIFSINITAYFLMKVNSLEYLFHIIKNIFLNVFLVSLVGILLGILAALAIKRIPAYLLLIVFTLIGAGVFYPLFIGIYNDTGFNAYPILDLFSITAPSIKWTPNTHFGFSLLSYQYQRIGIWVFGVLSLILFSIAPHKKTVLRPVAAISLTVCLGCAVFFYLPASKVNMEARHPESSTGNNYYSDDNLIVKEEEGGFQITEYDLDFKINRQLKATATLTINRPDLETYKFTLSHSYKVKSVTDQNETPLVFQQEGDYIAVKRGNSSIEKIIMTYSGYDNQFYANRQGVFLPGQFTFYPYSGYKKIMNDTGIFEVKPLDPAANFHVTTDLKKEVFTNLEEQPNGSYTGTTDSLTLMSGFLNEIEINGVNVIYPYLDKLEYTPELLQEEIDILMQEKQDNKQYRQIFLMPNVNLRDKIAVFEDYLNASYLYDILPEYEKSFIPQEKHDLYDLRYYLKTDTERYEGTIQTASFMAEKGRIEADNNIPLLFDKALKAVGEEKLISACEAYLNDNSDTRTSREFLNDLLKESI